MYSIESSRSRCERKLLEHAKDFDKYCKINVTSNKDQWIQLKRENMWIYGLQNKTSFNVIRASSIDTVTLQGAGMMELQPDCEISQSGFTIMGKTNVITQSTLDFQPMMNLSKFILENPTGIRIVNVTMDSSARLQEIDSKIKEIHVFHQAQTHHDFNTALIVLLTLSLTLALGVASYILWDKFSHHCINNERDEQRNQIQDERLPISVDPVQDGRLSISVDHVKNESSVAIKMEERNNTEDRHGPGGCPFRT